jgi:hypothetical protein
VEHTEREQLLRRLIEWRPGFGVLSVYVRVDPADRSQGWRIALREQLRALEDGTSPHDERRAFDRALTQVLDRFPENGAPPEGRGHVGFVELSDKRPAAVWRSMQMEPRRTQATRGARPCIRPLVELFAAGPHVGVALASADRVRLLDWSLGAIRGLDDWEMTLFLGDWRERKSERSLPGPRSWASASGRDQFDQRLEANRERFLHEVGSRISEEHARRKWRHILVFGTEDYPAELVDGMSAGSDRVHVVRHDLVTAPEARIAEGVADGVRELNDSAARAAVEEVEEAIGAEPGVALGPQETLQALAGGRARHLVFDAQRDYEGLGLESALGYDDGGEGVAAGERMVELAVSTKADITPVYEESAAKLGRHDGVAALLRY